MRLSDINPFLRFAELQPSVLSSAPLSCSYDYRIFYILEGTANFVLSDRTVPISADMLIYFRPGTPYYFDGKVKIIVLNFDMTREQSNQKTPRPPSKSVDTFDEKAVFENAPPRELANTVIIEKVAEIGSKMEDCLLHYTYPTAFSDACTSAILKEILCYVAQRSTFKGNELPEIVQKITLYIQQNYDKDISNSQISEEFSYHSFYLNRIFKKSMGVTIHQAVINERMRIAKKLLRETKLTVNDIANEVGYSEHSRFCTAFKKHVGNTPLEYRKNNQ